MSSVEPEQVIRKAGRPRSAESHQAILEATIALFAEEGLQGLNIEAIAERAGVGKTTIYRRWSSKEEIIKDALDLYRANYPIRDTGNIRHDLLYIAREAQAFFNNNPLVGKLIIKLIAEVKTKPEIYQAFYEKIVASRMQQFRQMVEHAQQRGELRSDLDTAFIFQLIFTSLIYNNLFSELVNPGITYNYNPAMAVDTLLRGIGTSSLWQTQE